MTSPATSAFDSELTIAPGLDPERDLPAAGPTLVLLGSSNAALLKSLDQLAGLAADVLDLRADVLWTQVPNGRAFLETVLNRFGEHRDEVRFAFAPIEATVDQLVRRALLAPDLNELARRAELEELHDLRPDFQIRYQPIVSLVNDEVVGFEALMRASAGERSITADELIRRARDDGWIADLDALGRNLALQGIGPWLGQGLLFLNIMAPEGEFDLRAVRATVDAAVAAGLDPDQIVFETAERNRYADLDRAADQVNEMRKLGVRIAVDDVGDGFSSLKVVAAFAPDIVKITGELVAALPSKASEAIITAVVSMAHEANAWVIAENIETPQQADMLRSLGVDWGQGHLLGVPASR